MTKVSLLRMIFNVTNKRTTMLSNVARCHVLFNLVRIRHVEEKVGEGRYADLGKSDLHRSTA